MLPRRPGPSSTTRGAPVSSTGSPGRTPLVSSYTWMIVLSPAILMTSPNSRSFPTNWTSYIRGRRPIAVTTGPATRKISPAPFAPASLVTAFIASSVTLPLWPAHLYRSTPIARLIFERRSSSCCFPTAMTTGRGAVSSRCRIAWLRVLRSSALRTRIPMFGSSRTFMTCASRPSRETLYVFRTPASLNPCTKSSRPTAASSMSDHQEFPNHFRGQATLLSPCDDPEVLDFPILAHDVVEDRKHGEWMDVGLSPRAEEVQLLHGPNELANSEGL